MSVFGKISGHLIAAREVATSHDARSDFQRLAIEVTIWQIDIAIRLVRAIHHYATFGRDDS